MFVYNGLNGEIWISYLEMIGFYAGIKPGFIENKLNAFQYVRRALVDEIQILYDPVIQTFFIFKNYSRQAMNG
jgi:hypothetical protein